MKLQITRFSPHQNAKVFAILMAVSSLIFVVPFFLIMALTAPAQARPPMFMLVAMPVMYLVFGYISVAIGCAIYNILVKYTGGIEFDSKADSA